MLTRLPKIQKAIYVSSLSGSPRETVLMKFCSRIEIPKFTQSFFLSLLACLCKEELEQTVYCAECNTNHRHEISNTAVESYIGCTYA